MGSEFNRLAYEASVHTLDRQERVLDELRARTGLLLAASSLAASFLGRPALDAQPVLLIGALAAFGVSVGASVYILVPRRSFTFSLFGSAVFEELYDYRDDMDEVHRRLTYDLDRFWRVNDDALQPLFAWFERAAVALGVEIVLLLAAISDTAF